MRVYEKNKHWYLEGMIRGKRYHEAIPEATTKTEATTYMFAFKTDLLRGRLELIEDIGSELFGNIVDDYIQYANINLKSTDTVLPIAKKFKELWGKKQCKDINVNLIEQYKLNRNGEIYYKKMIKGKMVIKYISPATVNRELGVLSRIFSIALDNKKVRENPVEKVKYLKITNKIERHMSQEEQDRLMQIFNHDYSSIKAPNNEIEKISRKRRNVDYEYIQDISLISLNTGLRIGEVLNLTWDCVDLVNDTICALNTKNGLKNIVPINKTVKKILEKKYLSKGDDMYVFTNPNTKTRYKCISRSFRNACKLAGIDNFRFHDTRHTFASRAVEKNTPLPVLQSLMNHKNIRTTMRYIHDSFEQKREAVCNLDNY